VERSGLVLARRYYEECVKPIVLERWPGLPHAGARLGSGSDVLGLDDSMSRDHDWGLRLTLLVDQQYVQPVSEVLERELPQTFSGSPTRFGTTWDPMVRHQVQIDTPVGFATSRLGIDAGQPFSVGDWLSLTGQALLEVTAGEVFADTHRGISRLREMLAWYSDDLWRYVVAADWARIGEELPVMGRTGFRGDEAGSRVLAARLVQSAMHLGFLLERRWPPYPKWLGTLFARLPSVSAALPALIDSLTATNWQQRQERLCAALSTLHDLQRTIGLPGMDDLLEPFWDRPFRGVHGGVIQQLLESITDEEVRRLPPGVGSIEQWADSAAVLVSNQRRALTAVWAQ
jgi:hypothetical protein